jgi:hypothetical protein
MLHWSGAKSVEGKGYSRLDGSRWCYLRPWWSLAQNGWSDLKWVTCCYTRATDSDSLLSEPALGRFASPLENDGVALEAAGHVVPG